MGADDFMPTICWTRYFLLAQGYDIKDNILFQDNKSSILLEKNGKASSSKRTKHINIRCFFITDRVSQGEVSIAWCPTGDMIGDYATKPLQGALFRKFRDQIMGVTSIQDPGPGKVKPVSAKVQSKKTTATSVAKRAGLRKPTKSAARVPPQHSLCALKKCGTNRGRGRAGAATLPRTWKGHGVTPHATVDTKGDKEGMVPSRHGRHNRSVLGYRGQKACASRAHASQSD